jgi:hypothetical protein
VALAAACRAAGRATTLVTSSAIGSRTAPLEARGVAVRSAPPTDGPPGPVVLGPGAGRQSTAGTLRWLTAASTILDARSMTERSGGDGAPLADLATHRGLVGVDPLLFACPLLEGEAVDVCVAGPPDAELGALLGALGFGVAWIGADDPAVRLVEAVAELVDRLSVEGAPAGVRILAGGRGSLAAGTGRRG